jgi:hypothetical protein
MLLGLSVAKTDFRGLLLTKGDLISNLLGY